jgi:transposase-like protein
MSSNLQNPIFTDERAAREWLEARVWPNGPVCPHCGATDADVTKLEGSKHRPGVYQCNQCREQFTVTVKTLFERSHVPLSKWLAALFLLTASKKGVSAHQVHRSLAITYKTAWFMMHRLREALRTGNLEPMGGAGKTVEADETYQGNVATPRPNTRHGKPRKRRGPANKRPILALVERGGKVRTFHVPIADKATVEKIVLENVARESRINTDESKLYGGIEKHFAAHETVQHSAEEYVIEVYSPAPDTAEGFSIRKIHTNTAEGYFSVFKRGMKGVYQHCSEKHLHRYLAEFDFRYNNRVRLGVNDFMRAEIAATGIKGKRLTYRRPHEA